ncbi:hypothetical protein QBZ16_001221 [Prototheca wickerhamii]|uniref:Proteasome endopeptidase complex n=1 Tax=Prototheca wickerhamii TaxID=3111 RepID=A0AAD9MG85_PROWI|nr:hypothetical protein QBZ16_001221 [Prototheca wickerhamii]
MLLEALCYHEATSAADSAALTVLRYLVDYARRRSLSLLRLVTETHDAVGLSGHLLLLDGPSPGSDPAAPEIQAWLLLHSALMDDGVRARIDLAEDSCRTQFRALAERLSPRVIAAVPVLRDLHAFFIEAAAWQAGPASASSPARARPLIEVVLGAEDSKQATLNEAAWAGVRALAYQTVAQAARQLVTPAGKPVLARLLATLELGWQVAEQGAGRCGCVSEESDVIQLTKIDQPMARDASSGLWLPYQPSQAAITFLKQPRQGAGMAHTIPLKASIPAAGSALKEHASWSPYDDNGGTVVAVAGNDYCIVGGSKRLSTGYSILTRDQSKILKLSPKVVIASAGMQADRETLHKTLHARHVTYQFNHRKPMSCGAMAQLLSNTLYYKRFFPYYTFNLCAGLDEEGRGAIYTYDAIGSYERVGYGCQGSGKELMQPVLDSQLKAASPLVLPPQPWLSSLPLEVAVDLVKSAFTSAGERDIYTGDDVEILIITKDGVETQNLPLKRD